MTRIFKIIYSTICWTYVAGAFITHRLVGPILALFYKDWQWGLIKTAGQFLRTGFNIMGIRMQPKGLENIPKEGPFILVSNHQSFLDIVVFMALMPRKFSFIAKKELLSVPLLGWEMKKMGQYTVDRNDAKAAMRLMDFVKDELLGGRPLLIFPEGTRSPDGELGEFKRGSFMIAVQTGVPVIPCKIDNAYHIMPKGSNLLRPGTIRLSLLPPIAVQKVDKKSEEKAAAIALKDACFAAIASI